MDTASEPALAEHVGSWLKGLGTKDFELRLLAGDVSPRRYFRALSSTSSTIVAAYPESLLDAGRRFVETTRLLTRAGIRVPEVLAFDEAAGLMLLEDAGGQTVFELRQQGWSTLAGYLASARQVIDRLQTLDPQAVGGINPPLGGQALRQELEMTWDLHLEPTGLCGSGEVRDRLHAALTALCDQLESGGMVPCHRDFMARNLVPLPDGSVLVLDHQDLRLGPASYDVASLTNDSLFLSPERCRAVASDSEASSLSYRRCAAQRSLKIVGTFVSFSQRGSSRYLPWVDGCMARAFDYLTSLPEGEDLAEPLRPLWRSEKDGRPARMPGRARQRRRTAQ